MIASVLIAVPAPSVALSVINVPADYLTIQGAINAASNGDEILVAPGSYTQSLDFKGKDIVVRSSHGPDVTEIRQRSSVEASVIMRSGEPASATIEGFTFRRNHPHALSPVLLIDGSSGRFIGNVVKQIDGIHADDGSVEAVGNEFLDVDDYAFRSEDSDVVFRRNLVVGGADFAAITVTGKDRPNASVEIADNRVHLARDKAMWASGLDAPVVRNNMFTMNDEGVTILGVAPLVTSNVFALDGGVVDFQGTHGGRFLNNTVYAAESNDRPLRFRGPASTVVANNIFAGTTRRGIVECTDNLTLRHNTFWNTKAGSIQGNCSSIGQHHNQKADPQFLSVEGLDFHVRPGSSVIDSGRIADAPATDRDGNPRPLDGDGDGTARPDRGAFELTRTYVRGTVTQGTAPRSLVCVAAHGADGTEVTRGSTLNDGTYRLSVSPGTYRVKFEDCTEELLRTGWYDGQESFATATPIPVANHESVTGIDAAMLPDKKCDGLWVTIIGTSGNDTIAGTDGDDVIAGLDGDDVINAGKGDDTVCAGDGRDTINGGGGNDRLLGGPLRDIFLGSWGSDFIDGGPKDDRNVLDLSASPSAVTVKLNRGRIFGWGGRDLTRIQEVIGTDYDDTLIGDKRGNTLRGRSGNDRLEPKAGYDFAYGDDGHDVITAAPGGGDLIGGSGDDLFVLTGRGRSEIVGDIGIDAIVVEQPEGALEMEGDDVRIGVALHRIDGIEVLEATAFDDLINVDGYNDFTDRFLVFGGFGNDVMTGGGSDQYLDAGPGDDTLISAHAYQILVGGLGNDHLESLGNGALMAPGPGTNTVVGSDDPDDAVTFEFEEGPVVVNLPFGVATGDFGSTSLEDIDHVVGTAFNDTITGGSADNILIGLEGADTVRGGDGDDILDGNEGSDFLNGGNGDDWCYNGESHHACEHIADLGALFEVLVAARESANPRIAELMGRHLAAAPIRLEAHASTWNAR